MDPTTGSQVTLPGDSETDPPTGQHEEGLPDGLSSSASETLQRRQLHAEDEQHSERDRTDDVVDRQQSTDHPRSNTEEDGTELLQSQHSGNIDSSAPINEDEEVRRSNIHAGEGHQVELNEQQLPLAEQQSDTNLGTGTAPSEPQRPVEEELAEHNQEQIQQIHCGEDAQQSEFTNNGSREQDDRQNSDESQFQEERQQPGEVQMQVEDHRVPGASGNTQEHEPELQQWHDEQGQGIPLQMPSRGKESQLPDPLQGENAPDEDQTGDITQQQDQSLPMKPQAEEAAQAERNSGGVEEGTPTGTGAGASRHTRKAKTPKRSKKSHGTHPPVDTSTESGAAFKETTMKRATEILFDAKTATALQSLCALQQQTPGVASSSMPGDSQELEEVEKCFVFGDDEIEAEVLEKERADRLQRIESLRTVAIVRQNISTKKAFQALEEALTSEEVVVGFAEDIPEEQNRRVTEAGEVHKKQEERLQSQADRLRQEAQMIRDRVVQQVKNKQAEFKEARKVAAREHDEREAEMLQTLQSFQLRLEAILQHRQLELLQSYGFLRRDYNTTNYSLKGKIPRAANAALGLERGSEGPNWKIMPQTLRLRLDLCRAVKDSVPRGQYVMMASVWNRLGGHRLVWKCLNKELSSSEESKQNAGENAAPGSSPCTLATGSCAVSAPVAFAAMYFSECLRFDETLYLNCPSEADIKPSMCLVFQLYLLRGAVSPVDKVVAWGAFPLVGPDWRIVEGSFKVPLFLGEVDTSIQRYLEMEDMIRTRLDKWLCNLYFRVIRMPKEIDGIQEFEVPLHYTARMLSIPDELPLPVDMRFSSSARNSQSIRNSRSSTDSSSAQKILRSMLMNRETIEGQNFQDGERQARHRALSYGMQPFSRVTEQDLASYEYSLISEQTLLHRGVTERKLRHIWAELFEEYSISSDMKEISLAGAALLFALGALWFAVFVALFGSWVTLKACNIPVYSAEITGLYIRFGYVQELLSLGPAALYSASGFVAALLVFATLCLIAHLAHCFVGRLPNAAYRFMAPLGIWVLILPALLALIEACGSEYSGMTFALYNCLEREFASGATGVALTVLMDLAFMALSSVLLYYYAVAIHHNGRVLDCHRRLTSDSAAFRFPNDTEVSERYMKACCYTAKQFVGLDGEIRRVQVTQLRVLDCGSTPTETAGRKKEDAVTTYIAIFTVHPKTKQQTLYRHFLRHPDGTILEQLYSVPLNLELSASNCPAEVKQCSFEETGFLQHQPTESVMTFEEWRQRRFGNMRPTVIMDSAEEMLQCSPAEQIKQIEAPFLVDCLDRAPMDEEPPTALPQDG